LVKKSNILFRFSGGRAIGKELGLGHVYRSLNLAQELNKHNLFFLIEDYGNVSKLISERGFINIFHLKPRCELKEDTKKTIKLIKEKKINLVIIDKYKIPVSYLKKINAIVKSVYIADLWKYDYPADIVVNGFIGLKNQIILNKYGAKCCLGPKYQILDRNFQKKGGQKKRVDLLATFGGFDENNLIKLLLKNYEGGFALRIILGPSTKIQKIKEYQKIFGNNISFLKETKNMAEEIKKARFGICSGGITSYEFACFNVPFAIICQAKHQMQTARVWDSLGIAKNLGFKNRTISSRLKEYLRQVNNSNLRISHYKKIDGNGSTRIAKEIIKLL